MQLLSRIHPPPPRSDLAASCCLISLLKLKHQQIPSRGVNQADTGATLLKVNRCHTSHFTSSFNSVMSSSHHSLCGHTLLQSSCIFLAQLPGQISQFVFGRRRIFSYLSEQGERATGDGDGAHGGREDGRVRGRGGRRREDGRRGRSGQGRRVRRGRGKHGRGRRGGGGRGRGEGRRVRRGAEILPALLSMRGPVQQRHRLISSAVQVL